MPRATDYADQQHFKAWTKNRRLRLDTRQAMWKLFQSDPDYWSDKGWTGVLRAVESKMGPDATRGKNPRRHSAKWDRCVRDVRRRGGATVPEAVCTAALKRRKNPVRDPQHKKLVKELSAHFAKDEAAMKRQDKRPRRKNPGSWGRYYLSATKRRNGARYYYAGGARLASETHQAIVFPSFIHATRVKEDILSTFPRTLTKAFLWQVVPA